MGKELIKTDIERKSGFLYYCGTDNGKITVCETRMGRIKGKKLKKSVGEYLGYKMIEDNRVKELKLPKKIIDSLKEDKALVCKDADKFVEKMIDTEERIENGEPTKEIELTKKVNEPVDKLEIILDKFFICRRCGFKKQAINGKMPNEYKCDRCGNELS